MLKTDYYENEVEFFEDFRIVACIEYKDLG
jgi:hypothetical protein